MLYQVRSADAKRLELRPVDSPLDPLVHRLARDRRVYELAGFFYAVVVAHLVIGGPVFPARTADAEARKSVSEVHDCQLYHSVPLRAIALLADFIHKPVESQEGQER